MSRGADLGYLLNNAARMLRLKLAESLADTGLTPQQAAVLIAVAAGEDRRLTPRSIADSIGTDAATTTGLLARLTRDGWLTTEPNPNDGRSRLIGLTEKAEASLPDVMKAARLVSQEATRSLSASEVDTLTQLLERLCEGDEHEGSDKADAR